MIGVGTIREVTGVQLIIMEIAMEETEDKAKFFALLNMISPFHKGDKTLFTSL